MRPVTKGDQGVYDPVVDVTSQAKLKTTLDDIEINFGGTATAKIEAVWDTSDPTASQVLDGLLMIAKQKAQGKGKPPKKKAKKMLAQVEGVKETVDRKLATIYGTAAGVLEGQLGRFCSFCELYNQTGVAVEHVVPKAQFPLFYIAWDNFLLACSVCNSIKKSQPPRNDKQFTPTPADEVGYYTTIRSTYLWPHKYNGVYRATKPQLEYQVDGNWFKVDYPVADGTLLTTQNTATRTLKADVLDTVTYKNVSTRELQQDVPVRVQVIPDGDQSVNMVKLVNLNKPSSNDKKPGAEADIRVWTRTLQWFKALRVLRLLMGATAGSFDETWQLMMESVQSPGLYSVWVTVLDLLGPGGSWKVPGDPTTSVMDKFLAEIVGTDYFPGTDTADTP